MESIEQIKARIESTIPGAGVEIVLNGCPAGQSSLLLAAGQALAIARFLRDDPDLRLDYASNVTGVDYLDKTVKEKIRSRQLIDGQEREIEQIVETQVPGCLEVVYHIYSIQRKHGPLVLRLRSSDRLAPALPSLTPVWRSAELQEREVFDLFGVRFEGHPDLRRILLWDEFEDHPMRKDYASPDDYEYEPTPHNEVLEAARRQQST